MPVDKTKGNVGLGMVKDATAKDGTYTMNPLVNANRRRLAKFGLGAPVLASLASRPVLAGQCLSNMMSGNLSNPNRGHCSKGWSPGGWGQPGGMISTYSTSGAWSAIGLDYGSYVTSCGNASQVNCYSGGTLMSGVPAVLNKDSVPTNTPLRVVLTNTPTATWNLTRHLVCAYLNAKLGSLTGSSFMYILSVQQVLDLASGTTLPPNPYTSLNDFLDSTWT